MPKNKKIKGGEKYQAPERKKLNLTSNFTKNLEAILSGKPQPYPDIPTAPPLSNQPNEKPIKEVMNNISNGQTVNLIIDIGKNLNNIFRYEIRQRKLKSGGILGVDEFLTAEDLAHRVMSQKTTNARVNLLKQINDVNEKTYDQAILGLNDLYPADAGEIILKAAQKIQGGKKRTY